MQKIFLGILGLLVLFLAAANARLQNRERVLEQRLAAAEKRTPRKAPIDPEPMAAVEAQPVVVPAPAPIAESKGAPAPTGSAIKAWAASTIETTKLQAKEFATDALALAKKSLTFTLQDGQMTLVRAGGDEELGLTEAQRKMIDDVRKSRDQQALAYTDMIDKLDARTEQSIRQILNPDQLAKYDAQHSPNLETQTIVQADEPRTASGLKPGYLGISGGDAPGGGAQVTQVLPHTVASGLGLQKDDVILEFNGEAVSGLSALSTKIKESGEGFPVTLKLRRGGNEFYQSLQLGGWPK
jgi:C-terminal processing protease CtpA/Prc